MIFSRQWFTVTLPQKFSAWLLHSYRRPIGLFCGLIVVPLVAVFIITYQVNVSLWRRQTLHNLGVSAHLGAEIIQETLDKTLDGGRMLAARSGFVEAVADGDVDRMMRHLQEVFGSDERIDSMMVVSPQGRVMAFMPARDGRIGTSIAEDVSFQEMRADGWRPYVSAVYLREGPEIEKIIGIFQPVERDGVLVGLVQVEHRIEEIKSWIQKIRVEPAGFLYVVDHHDQLVVFPFQVRPGKPKVVSEWAPVAYTPPAEGGHLTFKNARTGKPWLAAVYPLGGIGWRVVTVQPEGAALRTLHQVFGVLGIVVVLLVGLVGLVGSRWFQLHAFTLRLLQQNAEAMKQLQQRSLLDRSRRFGKSGESGRT